MEVRHSESSLNSIYQKPKRNIKGSSVFNHWNDKLQWVASVGNNINCEQLDTQNQASQRCRCHANVGNKNNQIKNCGRKKFYHEVERYTIPDIRAVTA